MNTRLIGLTALAATAALVPASPAVAKKETKSEIHAFAVTNSIAGQGGDFVAAVLVESKSKKCIRSRSIEFSRDGKKFGTAKTDKNGEAFAKTGSDKSEPGNYKAKMKKKGDCSSDTSAGKVTDDGTFEPK